MVNRAIEFCFFADIRSENKKTVMRELTISIVIILLFFSLVPQTINAQVITGKVLNEQNEPVPLATVYISELKTGTISSNEGKYRILLGKGIYHFTVRSLGYRQLEKEISITKDSINFNFILQKQDFQIQEVKIVGGKEDPAMMIMRKAIANAPFYRKKIKHYEADLYIKSNFIFQNIPMLLQNKTEINGKKMKEVFKEGQTYVIESGNRITYDYPGKYKQVVISKKSSLTGFDEPPVMELMTTNFYEERPGNLISPLSSQALKRYNFKYEGFITNNGVDVFKIRVIPKRRSDELVKGYIYIIDKLWCISNLDFDAEIKFINIRFKQQYENIGNNNWMPVTHIMKGDLSVLGLKAEFNYGASLKYRSVIDNTTFDKSEPKQAETKPKPVNQKVLALQNELNRIASKPVLSNREVKETTKVNRKILKEQYKDSTLVESKTSNYQTKDLSKDTTQREKISWDSVRVIPLTAVEIHSYAIADSLEIKKGIVTDSISGKKIEKKKSWFSKTITGSSRFYHDSVTNLNYSGLISLSNLDFNAVDGYKYKQDFKLNIRADSGKFIFINSEIGYAFDRKAIFWSVENNFNNVLSKNNNLSVYFGKKSQDFKSRNIGIDPFINLVSSWCFAQNYMKLYESTFFKANLNQKIYKDLRFSTFLSYNHFTPLENHAKYLLSDKKEFSPNVPKGLTPENIALSDQRSFVYGIGMNYSKRQRKPWLEKSSTLLISDYYSFNLSFRQGLKNVLSSVSDFSHLDFNYQQQANLSPSNGLDWYINAGYFFNNRKMHFSQFKHLATSEIMVSARSFSNTFQLLNDYEYSTNKSYINAGTEYRSEYLLLRFLPFINRKSWSESLYLNYLSTPRIKNYWEAGYSINNLFLFGNLGVFCGFEGSKFKGWAVKFSLKSR